jgi:hypothetical protein
MATRHTHPLKAWRMTQRVWIAARKEYRTMTITDAATKFGVPYQTWMAWEKFEDEARFRRPDGANLKKLFLFTKGAIRPDHFHPIDDWREELAAIETEAAQQAKAA